MRKGSHVRGLPWLALVTAVAAAPALGQQAIISLPSADITGERQFFFMHETQARGWGDKPFWSGTYFLTYGLHEQVELAATLFDLGVYPGGGTGTSVLALGLKANVPLFTETGWAPTLTFGGMALGSLVGLGWGAWMYGLASVRLPVAGTRLAVGASWAGPQLYGAGQGGLSAVASVEQPLPIPGVEGLSLVAEWFSGTHELSNFIVGATWHPTPTWIFVLGWKVPTSDGQFSLNEQALVAEVGVFFPALGGAPSNHHSHPPPPAPVPEGQPLAPPPAALVPGWGPASFAGVR